MEKDANDGKRKVNEDLKQYEKVFYAPKMKVLHITQ